MKGILLLPTIMLLSATAFAQGSNGLIGHWDFNGTANDKSGNGLNGVVSGATLAPGFSNVPNTAYRFNGVDANAAVYDHIDVAYNSKMNLTNFSICAMLRPDSFNQASCQTSTILWRGKQHQQGYYALYYNDNTVDNDCNVFTPNKMSFLSDVGSLDLQVAPTARAYNTYIGMDGWYCVTTTYANDTLKMYVNGALRNAVHFPYTLQTTIDILRIGASMYSISATGQYQHPMYGVIDDVRLYNRALTQAEANTYCDSVKMSPLHTGIEVRQQQLQVVPNPAQNEVTVLLPAAGAGQVQLLNAMGQLLQQQFISADKVSFDLKGYVPGAYILRINYNEQTVVRKFLKQ